MPRLPETRFASLLAPLLVASLAGCSQAHPEPVASPRRPAPSGPSGSPPSGRPASPRLAQALSDLAKNFPGEAGIAIHSLDEGWVVSERGSQRFPQQSVFKLWLTIAALDAVDRGALRLDETIRVSRADLVFPYQPLAERVPPGGYDARVDELLELMITLSDNPSADLVMARLGGPEAVGKTLGQKGLSPLAPRRNERALHRQGDELVEAIHARPGERERLLRGYFDEPANSATALETVEALARLARGELLSPASTRQALGWMAATRTGQARWRAGLPASFQFGHKTGAGGDVDGATLSINDVGLVTAPDGRRWAVACFVGRTDAPPERSDRLMADAARALVASLTDQP